MSIAYACELTPDEDGGFVVTFPDVPEAITSGVDHGDALVMAADALARALEGYILQGWAIPEPSVVEDGQEAVQLPMEIAAKLKEYAQDSRFRGNDDRGSRGARI